MREHQQQLYTMVHISSMRLSSTVAEKSFQVTEISASLKIMGYCSVWGHSGDS